jgi:uncharacterized membrane protein YfcA
MSAIFPYLDANLAIAAVVAIIAGAMRGFAGFGSAMMMAPVFALLFGPRAMIGLVAVIELIVTVQLIPRAAREAEWRFVGPLSVAAVLCMPLGGWLLVSIDTDWLTRIVAGIVLVFVIVLASGWRYKGPKRLPITLGLGGISGAMVATTSIGGPPVLIYMLAGSDKPQAVRANIITYFAFLELFLLAQLGYQGLLDEATAWRAIALTPPFVAAAWLGSRGFRASSEAFYRRVALVFLLIVALVGLFG